MSMAGILPLSAGLRAKSTGSGQRVRIGDHLVQSGALSEAVLLNALEDQKRQDQKLGRILIANRAISDDDLLDALSNQTGLGRVDLAQTPCDPQLFRRHRSLSLPRA